MTTSNAARIAPNRVSHIALVSAAIILLLAACGSPKSSDRLVEPAATLQPAELIAPASIEEGVAVTTVLTITNRLGGSDVHFDIVPRADWITVSTDSVTLARKTSVDLEVTATCTGETGSHVGTIDVIPNRGPSETLTITLDCGNAATAPEDEAVIEEPIEEPIVEKPIEEPIVEEPVATDRLSWAPPTLTNPTTIQVTTTSTGNIRMDTDRDYVIQLPDAPFERALILDGGRNVVLIGGEIRIPWQGTNPTISQRTGLKIRNGTGTVHIEGLLIHGDDLSEGIQTSAPNAIIQIQNVLIIDVHARDQTNFSDNHPDILQTYGNVRELRVDRLTGSSDYQGLFFKADYNGAHGPITLRRVNVFGLPTARYLFWVRPQDGFGNVTLDDVWIDVHPNRGGGLGRSVWPDVAASYPYTPTVETDTDGYLTAHWNDAYDPNINGRIYEGRPPTGDYVTQATAGTHYTSPGYGN